MEGLEVGALVRVRSRCYVVEEVAEAPDLPSAPRGAQHLRVRLACLDDDAQGEPLEVLWGAEVDAKVLRADAWERVASRGFDEPRLFSAYMHTLRWGCVTSTDPKLFQAPYRAGIEVKAYQLEPLRKALTMPRVNLFIADDVGLGKTIEAGLILRELLMRQKVRRCVIACPPSVVRQWREEMEQRFGLSFVVFDREFVAARRQERGYSVNPWATHNRFILSHALLRDETYAAPLRDWLGEFASGSMLILDEAHNAAPASSARYAVDSKLTRAVRELAPRFEHRLFLSATPHNGHSNSFSALLEVLDPQKFCRGVPVTPKLRDAVMVRRLKNDLRSLGEAFPERVVERIPLDGLPKDEPALRLSALLQRYRDAREARMEDAPASKRAASGLVLLSLQKRLLSSIEAFARTLRVHRKALPPPLPALRATLPRKRERVGEQVPEHPLPLAGEGRRVSAGEGGASDLLAQAPGADDERAELSEQDVEREEDLALEAVTHAMPAPLEHERALLDEMTRVAEQARHEDDVRVKHLVGWIKQHLCPDLGTQGARWNPRRVLVFTEYTDTKRYLVERLKVALASSDRAELRLATFHGGMSEDAREEIKRAFNADPRQHPLRVLIATDAAREGINLQNHCADLFHFDIPWNPSRLEQRNGRIDRKLQREAKVRCHYYTLPQRAEDRVLEVLVEKTATIQRELGSLPPVVERRVEQLLRDGIRAAHAQELVRSLGALSQETSSIAADLHVSDEPPPPLVKQLQDLEALLKDAKEWIGLDERHLREALNASLHLQDAPALAPLDASAAAHDAGVARWSLPPLHERRGAGSSWLNLLDTLRAPRAPGQDLAQWRRDCPVRPVVFQDPGSLDGEAVHLHLEHRLVQRLLGRFQAQGFRDNDLSRACVVRTRDPMPRVLLLGRLSLYGAQALRLHDEIIVAAADWLDPSQRPPSGALHVAGEMATRAILQTLEDSLAQPHLREPLPDNLRDRLLSCAPADVRALSAILQRRADSCEREAKRDLAKRAEQEAKAMRDILAGQQARILQQQKKVAEDTQLSFAFNDDERRQLEADKHHWAKRLAALQQELNSEPERVRASYDVRARRLEPVGLMYLWPLSS